MTNPSHKKTHTQFEQELKLKHPGIKLLEQYVNTDTKILYECDHGTNRSRPWMLLKQPFCCRKGYYESGNMWRSNTNTLEEIKARIVALNPNINVDNIVREKPNGKISGKIKNLYCTIHNVTYDGRLNGDYRIGLCPQCGKDKQRASGLKNVYLMQAKQKAGFVSKSETRWLDKLGVRERQVWIEDIRYKVDGYDPSTKTVYLYHGNFWHGSPEKYAAEIWHPVFKETMGEVYQRTKNREKQILDAGYKLVVEWGD